MYITDTTTGRDFIVTIERIKANDYNSLSKRNYYFNWREEKEYDVYKLVFNEKILGLMSCIHHPKEARIEIKLLAVAKENRGANKRYERIAGNLIAFACRQGVNQHLSDCLVSLLPKTVLTTHYKQKYGFKATGTVIPK